ncbi:MAG: ABC transporter substrate-binding protein [Candidatus Tectomicrobia bacterium]|nr:ABC transporter substrate-binding protein [Candidatus Tectomicrobia bacterium]
MSESARMVLLILLSIIPFLLMYSRSESAVTSEQPALEMPGTKFGGIYRRMLGNNPSTLDPAFVTDLYGRSVVSQIFDGLVQFDANLNPIPALAEFWEASRDGRTWMFTLRQGVKFHHGREMTVHDVVYSLTRLLRVKSPGPTTDLFERIQGAKDFMEGKTRGIQGLKAIDRYALQMVLEQAFAPSLVILGLANAAVVPQEEVEKGEDRFGHAPVGTGPFKFVRWAPNQEIILEANDHYYEGRPFLDALVFKIVVGGKIEERFGEFLKGALEETAIPSGKMDEVRADPQYRKYQQARKPALSLFYIGFNTQLKPFDDKRVRQAFNYAVDKEAIVREIIQMGSLVATGVLPPGMPGYDPHLRGYSYDPAKAKQLLAEAGYPDGAGFPTVQLWSSQKAESTKAELAAYQRYLAEIGVQVDIHFAANWPAYKAMLEQGKLPMFRLIWVADIPDPDNFLFPLLHSASPTNRMFYRNPLVDQLLEQARKESDDARRITLYRQVERIVMDDAPWITQHHSVLEYLFQPYVQGVEINLLGRRTMPMKKIWFKKVPPEGSVRATTDAPPD